MFPIETANSCRPIIIIVVSSCVINYMHAIHAKLKLPSNSEKSVFKSKHAHCTRALWWDLFHIFNDLVHCSTILHNTTEIGQMENSIAMGVVFSWLIFGLQNLSNRWADKNDKYFRWFAVSLYHLCVCLVSVCTMWSLLVQTYWLSRYHCFVVLLYISFY